MPRHDVQEDGNGDERSNLRLQRPAASAGLTAAWRGVLATGAAAAEPPSRYTDS